MVVLVFYCYIRNCHKFNGLKQYKYTISWLLWVKSLLGSYKSLSYQAESRCQLGLWSYLRLRSLFLAHWFLGEFWVLRLWCCGPASLLALSLSHSKLQQATKHLAVGFFKASSRTSSFKPVSLSLQAKTDISFSAFLGSLFFMFTLICGFSTKVASPWAFTFTLIFLKTPFPLSPYSPNGHSTACKSCRSLCNGPLV